MIQIRRIPVPSLLCTALLLASMICFSACSDASGPTQQKKNKLAPDFSLVSLSGKQLTRESLQGKVVILDFWATWCPPCRAAIPHLVDLYNAHRDQGLEIVGVSLDRGGEEEVADFIRRNRVSYDIAIGTGNPIIKDFGDISSIPVLFILNREGEIVFKAVGFNSQIAKNIEDKLAEIL
ncbi:MAG: TlpA family protein disulfide reductase [Deltaproteobacteria bacterium]|nr:TlpA family protein disulfide reductase [Candidatus Anaeroferrophillacea bacterium]